MQKYISYRHSNEINVMSRTQQSSEFIKGGQSSSAQRFMFYFYPRKTAIFMADKSIMQLVKFS